MHFICEIRCYFDYFINFIYSVNITTLSTPLTVKIKKLGKYSIVLT